MNKVHDIIDSNRGRVIGHTTQGCGDRFNIFIKCSWWDSSADKDEVKFFGEYESLDFFCKERGWNLLFKKTSEHLSLEDAQAIVEGMVGDKDIYITHNKLTPFVEDRCKGVADDILRRYRNV